MAFKENEPFENDGNVNGFRYPYPFFTLVQETEAHILDESDTPIVTESGENIDYD